jgi:hypothetical protein
MTAFYGDREPPPLMGRFLPAILVWLLMVAVVGFLVVNQNLAATFASNARTARGTVIAREPNNHAIVRAAYEVDGAKYEVADSHIGPPNPDWDTVRVGDSVTVYYDPAAPARAVLYEPQARPSETGPVVLAALILATAFVGVLLLSLPLWKRLLRRRWSQPRTGSSER